MRSRVLTPLCVASCDLDVRCFIPGSFAAFIVRERQFKQKHQQTISGVSLAAYWTTTFLWDLVIYLVTAAICILLLRIFDVSVYVETAEKFGGIILLFILYGLSVIPFTYACTFCFKEYSTAQNTLILINLIFGAALTIASYVMGLLSSTKDANEKLVFAYRLFPGFCLGDGLLKVGCCSRRGGGRAWAVGEGQAVQCSPYFCSSFFCSLPSKRRRP